MRIPSNMSNATVGGPVTMTINGTSGSLTVTASIALTANAASSFTLSASAGTLSVVQGSIKRRYHHSEPLQCNSPIRPSSVSPTGFVLENAAVSGNSVWELGRPE
jgi:hypothetical protein